MNRILRTTVPASATSSPRRARSKAMVVLAGSLTALGVALAQPASAELSGDELIPADTPSCQGKFPTIYGGPDQSHVEGTSGNDVIGGDQTVHGEAGKDTICLFGAGEFTVFGGPDTDRIVGSSGPDDLYGGNGADEIRGGAGPDYIEGQDGDDTLLGGEGDDALFGGSGYDRSDGGEGGDRCKSEYRQSCGLLVKD